MYYKINQGKFLRALLLSYMVVVLVVSVIGIQLVKAKDIELANESNPLRISVGALEVIEVEKIVEVETVNITAPFEMELIGDFKVTAYTKSDRTGKEIMQDYKGVSVAVDPSVIPYGTKLWVEGVGIRQAQPGNQLVVGNEIKVYFDTLEDKEAYGEKTISIYKVID